jgi:hypothetical protein
MKKILHSIINYIYILLLLYLCFFALTLFLKGCSEGFLNLDIRWHKTPLIVGIPVLFTIILSFLIKKLE